MNYENIYLLIKYIGLITIELLVTQSFDTFVMFQTCMNACIHTYIHRHTHTHTYTYTHTHTHMHTHTHTHTHIYIYVHIHTHIHTYTAVNIKLY